MEEGQGEAAAASSVAIGLVACGKRKQTDAVPARELYTAPLFRLSRAYVEARCGRWFILSALHGLLDPEVIVEPYDKTLNGTRAAARRAWGRWVAEEFSRLVPAGTPVLCLAGDRYTGYLLPILRERGFMVEEPLQGLTLGRRLAFLKRAGEARQP